MWLTVDPPARVGVSRVFRNFGYAGLFSVTAEARRLVISGRYRFAAHRSILPRIIPGAVGFSITWTNTTWPILDGSRQIRSAKPFSIFRNRWNPNQRKPAATQEPAAKPGR
jgi:hypothetical protein